MESKQNDIQIPAKKSVLARAAILIFLFGLVFGSPLAARADCISEPMMQGQDPDVVYMNGYFNLVQSDGCNVRLIGATSLAELSTSGSTAIYAPGCSNMWAPDLFWYAPSNCWFIYYSEDTGATGAERVHVAQSRTSGQYGPYFDRGVLLSSYWNIDGAVFTATNGQLYFVYSGSPSGRQNIYISAMSNPYTLSGSPVMVSAPTQSWETNGEVPGVTPAVNEGPFGFVHNGQMFIVYSASGCWTDDYCLGLLTLNGTNPLNAASWTKSGPVFSKEPSAYGPGGASVFVDGSNQWWNIYHANNLSGQGCGGYRQLHVQRIFWNADGSPYFGAPVPTNSLVVADTNWLVAQYPLTATNGVNAATTTCGASGVFVGSPVWQNPGLKFNGVSDYVNCGSQLGNDVQSTLTLAAWIKADAFNDWGGIVTKGVTVSPYALQVWHDGSIRFTACFNNPSNSVGGGSWNSNAKLATNQWYHVAVTYDGAAIRFYTNGVLDSVQAVAGMHFGVDNEPMTIGADLPGSVEYFKGTIRDVRVYGRALSALEINQITGISPPVLAPIPDQQTSAGLTLLITDTVTDAETPPPVLTFSLLNQPSGASIGGSSGIFSWRPAAIQANSTNLVTICVADNSTPSLSATQSFNVTVGPLALPVVNSPMLSNGLFQMTVTGDYGPDYQMWRSTNLIDWELLQQLNSPVLPFNWTDPAATTDSARFYRIQLSP